MKKSLLVLFLVAVMTWFEPICYEDGSIIPIEKTFEFNYRTYYGYTSAGPWLSGPVTTFGDTSAIVPNPPPCKTWWYTVEAELDGGVSDKAPSVWFKMPKKRGKCPK